MNRAKNNNQTTYTLIPARETPPLGDLRERGPP